MKHIHYYILCVGLLLLSVMHGRAEQIDTLLHFNLADLQIDTLTAPDGQTYTKLFYPGCCEGEDAGSPNLPIKYVRVKLPYYSNDIFIDVQQNSQSIIPIGNDIYPVQPPMTGNMAVEGRPFVSGVKSIYDTNKEYPSAYYRLAENSSIRKEERCIVVAIYPIVYNPSRKKLTLTGEIHLSVSFNISSNLKSNLTRATNPVDVGLPYYEYTVITSRALKDSFERLIAWKRQKGINAGVVCVEDITENNAIVGDTASHRLGYPNIFLTDDAAKIRQYLRYSYEAGVAKYALMGGCSDIVPIRYASGQENTWEDEEYEDMKIPTDHYFSELYSNWNKDNDIYLGEPSDDINYGYQLSVGRILCTTAGDVENYTDKLLLYEINPGKGNSNYIRSAFYQVSNDWMLDPTSPLTLLNRGVYVAERALNSFPDTTIINEYNINAQPSIYPTGNEVMSAMRQKHYGYATWMGHGSPYRIIVRSINISNSWDVWKSWLISSKQNIAHPDDLPPDSFVVENMNGLDKLANKNYPMIAFSHGCMNASFDVYSNFSEYPNMAQSFTLGNGYGGPAFIGHTRSSYIDNSYLVQDIFNNKLRRKGIGESLHRGKTEYVGGMKHYMVMSTNLIGCPEFNVWTDTLQALNVSIECNTDQGYITLDEITNDTVYVGLRYITYDETENDSTSYRIIPYHESEQVFNQPWNCLISLTGRNYRPKIMPLHFQNAILRGKRYLIVKDVTCTSDVLENTNADEGGVSFEAGSNYTFETSGTFRMEKNVVVKNGAKLCIKPSNINY